MVAGEVSQRCARAGATLLGLGPVLPVQQGLVAEHSGDEVGSEPAEGDKALASPQGPGSLPLSRTCSLCFLLFPSPFLSPHLLPSLSQPQ